jgi:uncharacterized protein (TIGR02246 family)
MRRLIARFLLAADSRKMTPPFHNRIRKVCPLVTATLILPALAISFALPTFAQQKETVDPQIIGQLESIAKKYEEAVNNNDAAAVAALFAQDAVFVTEGGPFYGREAIEKLHVDLFKQWRFSNHLIKTAPNSYRIIGTAENIASNGEWSQTLQAQGGDPIQRKGYWTAIDTREGNDWKILMLTPNGTPAPTATTRSDETDGD